MYFGPCVSIKNKNSAFQVHCESGKLQVCLGGSFCDSWFFDLRSRTKKQWIPVVSSPSDSLQHSKGDFQLPGEERNLFPSTTAQVLA